MAILNMFSDKTHEFLSVDKADGEEGVNVIPTEF